MRATVGQAFPPRSFVVDRVRVQEFKAALGLDDYDEGVPAAETVPAGFLMYVTTYGAEPIHQALDLEAARTLFAGLEVEMLAPVHVGDELTVRPEVVDVTTRTGRGGKLNFIVVGCRYYDTGGRLVATERSTIVERLDG